MNAKIFKGSYPDELQGDVNQFMTWLEENDLVVIDTQLAAAGSTTGTYFHLIIWYDKIKNNQ